MRSPKTKARMGLRDRRSTRRPSGRLTGPRGPCSLGAMPKNAFYRLALLLCLCLAGGSALGKEGRRVAGVVLDASGGAVAGADVSLLNAQQAVLGSARTDPRGRFVFEAVPHGSYVLR